MSNYKRKILHSIILVVQVREYHVLDTVAEINVTSIIKQTTIRSKHANQVQNR